MRERCPRCGEEDDLEVLGDGQALCCRCGLAWNLPDEDDYRERLAEMGDLAGLYGRAVGNAR